MQRLAHPYAHAVSPRRLALQQGWLRWPFAWALALIITLGMLATLAAITRPWVRPTPPERLAVALHRPQHQSKTSATTTPATPRAQTAPATRTTASATPMQTSSALMAPPPAALLTTANPTPQTPSVGHSGQASLETPAAQASSVPSPANQGAAALSIQNSVVELPLRQRCPQQVKPAFPRRALEDGIDSGRILARLHLEADGKVRSVQILEASPRGYFETEASLAAMQWRCLPSGQAGDSVRVPFVFAVE